MAGPFDFLFAGDDPEGAEGGDGGPRRASAPSGSYGATPSAGGGEPPEPFGFLDVLGIGMGQRTMQREQAYKRQGEARAEARASAVNKAESAIQQRVLELRAQLGPDAPNQQVFSAILRDPIFGQNAALVPVDRQQQLVNSIMKGTSPSVTMLDAAPGHTKQGVDERGRPIPGTGFTAPTAKVQEWTYLQGRSEAELSNIAKAVTQVSKAPSDSDKEQAYNYLESIGAVTRANRAKFIAGTLKLEKRAVRNATGELTEEKFYMVDRTDPDNVVETEVKAAPNVPGGPGAAVAPKPRAEQPPASEPVRKQRYVDDGSLHDAAGGLAKAADWMSRVVGQVPAFRGMGEDLNRKSDALARYERTLVSQMKDGRELKAEIEAIGHLLPDASDNPLTSANKMLGVAEYLGNVRTRRAMTYNDASAPREVRTKARTQMDAIDIILDQTPDIPVLQKRIDFYRQNPEWTLETPSGGDVRRRAGNVKAPPTAGDTPAARADTKVPEFSKLDDAAFIQEGLKLREIWAQTPEAVRRAWQIERKRRGL